MELRLHATPLDTQADDIPQILVRHQNIRLHDRLPGLGDLVDGRELGGIVHIQRLTGAGNDLEHHRGRAGDEVEAVFALEPLLDDFHVQHAEKTTTKAETQRPRRFGLVVQ